MREALEKSTYFGLDPEQIQVFSNGDNETEDTDGFFKTIRMEGIASLMNRRQLKHIFVYCVDNVLVKVVDPEFLGFCISRGAEAGNKVVRRRPGEEPSSICEHYFSLSFLTRVIQKF